MTKNMSLSILSCISFFFFFFLIFYSDNVKRQCCQKKTKTEATDRKRNRFSVMVLSSHCFVIKHKEKSDADVNM